MITKNPNCWLFVDDDYNSEKSSFDITRHNIITERQKLHKLEANNNEFLI